MKLFLVLCPSHFVLTDTIINNLVNHKWEKMVGVTWNYWRIYRILRGLAVKLRDNKYTVKDLNERISEKPDPE